MLNNKKFNIILSLIIAVGLWAYVIGETNPTDTKTFRDIPITFINGEVLEDSNLAVLETSADTMSVTLSGTRSNINKISERDITAVVDLADAAKGKNELKINVRVPDNVEIEDKSINKVTVVVENNKSKEVDIDVDYLGHFDSEEEPITVEMSRESVVVSGPSSLVNKVASVKAVVAEGKVTDELKTIKTKLTPVDKEGNEVKKVDLSAESISVTAELARTKTVPLVVPINDDAGDTLEKSTAVPKTITIKGKSSDLADIDSITTQEVDITDITEDTSIDLVPILPDKIQISDQSSSLILIVKIQALSNKTFTFDEGDVDLTGLSNDLKGQVKAGKIEIVVKGTEDAVAAIKKSDLRLSADLSDLGEGSHQVDLKVTCEKTYTSMEIRPEKIRVTIE